MVTPEVVPTLVGRRQVYGVNVLAFVDGRRPTTGSDGKRVAAYLVDLHELGRGASAWQPLAALPTSVIHGDPGASNVLITETDVVLSAGSSSLTTPGVAFRSWTEYG